MVQARVTLCGAKQCGISAITRTRDRVFVKTGWTLCVTECYLRSRTIEPGRVSSSELTLGNGRAALRPARGSVVDKLGGILTFSRTSDLASRSDSAKKDQTTLPD